MQPPKFPSLIILVLILLISSNSVYSQSRLKCNYDMIDAFKTSDIHWNELLDKACESLSKQQYDSAINYFEQLIKIDNSIAYIGAMHEDLVLYKKISSDENSNNSDSLSSADSIAIESAAINRQKEIDAQTPYFTLVATADGYFRKNDYNEALTNYEKAKALIPTLNRALDGITKCEEQLRLQKEKADLEEKRKIENDSIKLLAESLFKQRYFIECKPILDKLVLLLPKDTSVINKLSYLTDLNPKVETINTSFSLGNYDNAIRQCDQFSLSKKYPEFNYWKAQCYYKKDSVKVTKVFENLDEAIKLSSENYPKAQLFRAQLYLKQNPPKIPEAIGDYSTLIAKYPDNGTYYYIRGDARKEQLPIDAINDYNKAVELNAGSSDLFYKKGFLEFSNQKYAESIASFDSLIKYNSNSADAYFYKGCNYEKLSNFTDAGICFAIAREKKLDHLKMDDLHAISKKYYDAGYNTYYNNANDTDVAFNNFSNSILLDSNENAIFYRGLTLLKNKKPDSAHSDFDLLGKINPSYNNVFYNKGICLQLQNRDSDAITEFNTELSHHPDVADVYKAIGNSCIQLKQYKEAAVKYNKAYEISKNDTLLFSIGQAFYLGKDYTNATDFLTKSISAKAEDRKYFTRGMTYYLTDDLKTAIADLKKTTSLSPSFPNAFHYLGKAYFKNKDFENSAAAFESAKGNEPTVAENYYLLAQCYFHLKTNFEKIYSNILDAKRIDSTYNTANSNAQIAYGFINSGGDTSVYMNYIAIADKLNADDAILLFVKACMEAKSNNLSMAYTFLDKSLSKGGFIRDDIYTEPAFAAIKKSPDFKQLLEKYFKK